MRDGTMKTFRTEEEALKAGWLVNKTKTTISAFRGFNEDFEEARILSPETLKCVEALESIEWDGGSDCDCCPSCFTIKKNVTHAPDCKLDLALRQVGVRP